MPSSLACRFNRSLAPLIDTEAPKIMEKKTEITTGIETKTFVATSRDKKEKISDQRNRSYFFYSTLIESRRIDSQPNYTPLPEPL